MHTFIRYGLFALFTVLCFGVAYYAFNLVHQPINPFNKFQYKLATEGLVIPVHLFTGGLALALVPFQLSGKLRKRSKSAHRIIGLTYVICVLFGGISGLLMAINADGGWIAKTGFACLALLWLITTALAFYHAINGQIALHKEWIYRSVALTAAGITLRIYLGIGLGLLQLPFLTVYLPTAWLCWTLNLLVCEIIIYRQKKKVMTLQPI